MKKEEFFVELSTPISFLHSAFYILHSAHA